MSKRIYQQRKVCQLNTCTRRGQNGCMHCTCNGICNTGHDKGQCGDVREGSGAQCRAPSCLHDETCTHSKRAICYECRRHRVSKQRIKTGPVMPDVLPGIGLLGSIKFNEDTNSLKSFWSPNEIKE